MTDTTTTFPEMANAIAELGFSSQEFGDTELMAHRLRRAGMTEANAELAMQRMRRRNEVLADAQLFFAQYDSWDTENLIRELTRRDPPRWGVIWTLTKAVVRTRWRRLRRG